MRHWLIGSGIVVVAVLVLCLVALSVPQPPVVVLTPSDTENLAREGIHLRLPATPPTLSEAQVQAIARQQVGPLAQQAAAVTVRRVVYVERGSQSEQSAWLVTFDGLRLAITNDRRPSATAGGLPEWLSSLLQKLSFRLTYKTQLHILLDDNGHQVFTLSYR